MDGFESIDFSKKEVVSAAHFKLSANDGCDFREDLSAWEIKDSQGSFEFELNLGEIHGVELSLLLVSGLLDDGVMDCPITVEINEVELLKAWDPKKMDWYTRSFYIPANMLQAGANTIKMVADGGTSVVFLQKATVMSFQMQTQQQSQWCWAAVTASVAGFYNSGSDWTQCSLANAELGQTTCCADGSTSQCNQWWYLDRSLGRTGNLTGVEMGTLTVEGIDAELDNQRPVGARVQWSDGSGHFVIISGVGVDAKTIAIEDPFYGSSFMSYDTFKDNYQGLGGFWERTYRTNKSG